MNIGEVYDRMGKAVSSALGTADKLNAQPKMDEQLQAYSQLNRKDFDLLRMKFGDDATADYIKRMEARKMKAKNGL